MEAVVGNNFTSAVLAERSNAGKNVFKPIISDINKTRINYAFNGTACGLNFLTFLNGNLHIVDSIQESLEYCTSLVSKCATTSQGIVNATIEYEKKNLIAFIGSALELPIAFFIKGKNLFLGRGISAGLNHFDSIISRTKKASGEYYDHFREEGWIEGTKIIFRHIPKLTKELYEKPFERSGLFPRSFFLCSSFMIVGSCLAFLGFEKLGSAIRHFFGGTAGVALATDQSKLTNEIANVKHVENADVLEVANEDSSTKELKKAKSPALISNYAMSGILWVLAAIPDLFKHYDFFSSRVNNSSEIALSLDRLAGLFFISGNQRKGEK